MVDKKITFKDGEELTRVRASFATGTWAARMREIPVKKITPEEREASQSEWKAKRAEAIAEQEQRRAEEAAQAQAAIAARAETFEPAAIEVTFLKLGMSEAAIVQRRFGTSKTAVEAEAQRQRIEDLAFYRQSNGIAAKPMKLPEPARIETNEPFTDQQPNKPEENRA